MKNSTITPNQNTQTHSQAPTTKFTAHTLSLDNRKLLTMSGVEKMESSTATLIVLCTCQGRVEISGTDLKINRFDNQTGDAAISGNVNAIHYSAQKQPLLKRIFK